MLFRLQQLGRTYSVVTMLLALLPTSDFVLSKDLGRNPRRQQGEAAKVP